MNKHMDWQERGLVESLLSDTDATPEKRARLTELLALDGLLKSGRAPSGTRERLDDMLREDGLR